MIIFALRSEIFWVLLLRTSRLSLSPFQGSVMMMMNSITNLLLLLFCLLKCSRANINSEFLADRGMLEHAQSEYQSTLPDLEYKALYDLYTATNGSHWYWRGTGSDWNFSGNSDPCTDDWQGVLCEYNQTESHIVSLDLFFYNLVGTLPATLMNLTYLNYLRLAFNELGGTISTSLGSIPRLTTIDLSYNQFTGHIPNSFGNNLWLATIDLSDNKLSGYIPATLGSIAGLVTIDLSYNNLSGQIPSSLGNCSFLRTLELSNNALSGTLPSSLGNLLFLVTLDLYINLVEGHIPDSYGQLSNVQYWDMEQNKLTGTIPEFFGSLENLRTLYLNNNSFHGTLPSALGTLPNCYIFSVEHNMLTGAIPDMFGGIYYLYLGYNLFSGTLPETLGELPFLDVLYANNNQLTGSIPTSLSKLSYLEYLRLDNNRFHGTISGIVDPSVQIYLDTVMFSNNQLTGTLPSELFGLENLLVLDGGINCFSGALPDNICDAKFLQILALDGMHTSTACRRDLLPEFNHAYVLEEFIANGIPRCLFQMPNLTTLHLSGNGLTGSLPSDIVLKRSFVDFTMSNNIMTGTIPDNFQQKFWKSFDLSYNRLSGTLHQNFLPQANDSSITLRNNRLSGNIPPAIREAQTVDVLRGNLFSCNEVETDLPQKDDGVTAYQCGSNSFNLSYYFWLSATAVLSSCGLIYALRQRRPEVGFFRALVNSFEEARNIINVFELTDAEGNSYKSHLRRYRKICDICKLIVRMACLLTAYIVIILVPLYFTLRAFYSTHTHAYAYQVALMFLSGAVPTALALVLLTLFALFAFGIFVVLMRKYQQECVLYEKTLSFRTESFESGGSHRESASQKEKSLTWEKFSVYAGCVFINVLVVLSANLGFILVVLDGDDSLLSLAQVALSLFKTFWGYVCSWTAYHLAVVKDFESRNIKKGILSMLFIITLFNNIVAPCLIVIFRSNTCFYSVIHPEGSVTNIYSYDCSADVQSLCTKTTSTLSSSTLNPPFLYSYECAASFLTAYAPSFMYLCILSGFITPALRWMLRRTLRHLTKGSRLYKLIRGVSPMILQPISTSKSIPRKLFSPYFASRELLVSQLNYLGILMTFGAVFPPLAAAVCITIICNVFFSRLEVKRFLEEAALKNPAYIDVIDEDCIGVGSDTMLLRAIWVLISLSFCFYTLFLFDTLGDSAGGDLTFQSAYWVLLVVPLLPLLLYATFKYYTGTFYLRKRVNTMSSRVFNLELLKSIQQEQQQQEQQAREDEESGDSETVSPLPHNEL